MDMRIKKSCLGMLAACGMLFGAASADAEVSVTDVTAVPRYPWDGLVDIWCTVSGLAEGGSGGEFELAAVDAESGSVRNVSQFHVAGAEDKDVHGNGDHELVWDAREDLGEVVVSNMVVRVTVREKEEDPHSGGQLWAGGPYWADRNLGAEHPWDYGRYFWWGDTVGALPGGFSFSTLNTPTWDKLNVTLQRDGWITAAGVLAPEHDAAQVQWGGGWRMPTDQELQDLCDKCDWTKTTMSGVFGCVVRGRGEFANASIFIPAGGVSGSKRVGSRGYLWSSVPDPSDPYGLSSFALNCGAGGVLYNIYSFGRGFREHGYSIRPVRGSTE